MQKKYLISTKYDVLLINMVNDEEYGIDNLYHIANIKCIIHFKQKFFIMANRCGRELGFYILEIDEDGPSDKPRYVMFMRSRLDIGDPYMFLYEH